MSGFVAVIAREGERPAEAMVAQMASALAEYGPDGTAIRHEGPVAFAHALFAARGNATLGPHVSPRGTWITGDIRVDAQSELRRLLAAARVALPHDASDELLFLAAWDEWGADALPKIRGDFSAVIWDPARRLFCAVRDAMGVRPLYYAHVNGQLVCSNVIAAVRAMPGVTARLHEPAIVSFLQWGMNVDLTTTAFADIRRLAPAHCLLAPAERATPGVRTYWDFPVPAPLNYRHEQEYIGHYLQLMGDAVGDRLRVPSAAILLSGGLDSTAIAASARRAAPRTALHAYTWVTTPLRPDGEGAIAGGVARQLGMRHEIIGDSYPILAHLSRAGRPSPEPLDSPDASNWLALAPRIAGESRVLLVGEDGDALFDPPSLQTQFRSWPAFDVLRRAAAYTLANGHLPHTGLRVRDKLLGAPPLTEYPLPVWVRRDLAERAGPQLEPVLPPHPTRPEAHASLHNPLWQAMLAEYDRAFSRASVESRWPLLDTRLIEFVLAIPPIPWCQRKYLVRRAFHGVLPAEVLRRRKTGVAGLSETQVRRWRTAMPGLRSGFADRMGAYVNVPQLQQAMTADSVPGTLALWRALALDQWLAQ